MGVDKCAQPYLCNRNPSTHPINIKKKSWLKIPPVNNGARKETIDQHVQSSSISRFTMLLHNDGGKWRPHVIAIDLTGKCPSCQWNKERVFGLDDIRDLTYCMFYWLFFSHFQSSHIQRWMIIHGWFTFFLVNDCAVSLLDLRQLLPYLFVSCEAIYPSPPSTLPFRQTDTQEKKAGKHSEKKESFEVREPNLSPLPGNTRTLRHPPTTKWGFQTI